MRFNSANCPVKLEVCRALKITMNGQTKKQTFNLAEFSCQITLILCNCYRYAVTYQWFRWVASVSGWGFVERTVRSFVESAAFGGWFARNSALCDKGCYGHQHLPFFQTTALYFETWTVHLKSKLNISGNHRATFGESAKASIVDIQTTSD